MSNKTFIGVQLDPHSVFDEGPEHVLDLLEETAGVNALMVYTHTYSQGPRPLDVMAGDHGVDVVHPNLRDLTYAWVPPNEQYYAGTFLRHPRSSEKEYGDADVLAELIGPAKKRGMKVIPRLLEFNERLAVTLIPNWVKVLSVDCFGTLAPIPCWNNPDYQNFMLSTEEDLFRSYDIDGFQFGAERPGPLSRILFWDRNPACFCEHCCAKASAKKIDADRAREGYKQLTHFVRGLEKGKKGYVDGVLTEFIRIILKFPEILSWETMYYESKHNLLKRMYSIVKILKPEAVFGIHFDHQQSTWDMLLRAQIEYADVAEYCDFIKPIAYHDIAGPRIKQWYLERMHRTFLQELPLERILATFYDTMGLDRNVEPPLEELDYKGFTPDYVYRLTKRLVEGAQGKVPVYTGIGFDVPFKNHMPADPEVVYQATLKAFEAGAGGVVISREYDEMRVPNLRAVGRALRELNFIS